MATQPTTLSLEEFHQLYDGAKPAYEYWHGTAIQKSLPTNLHGILQGLFFRLLDDAGWNAATEVRLKIVRDAEPVPDVIAVRGPAPLAYPNSAPALCIEILSPDDSLAETIQKAAKYVAWGTECVWIIDPSKRIAWMIERGVSNPIPVPSTGSLRIRETVIELPALFAQVDRKLNWPTE